MKRSSLTATITRSQPEVVTLPMDRPRVGRKAARLRRWLWIVALSAVSMGGITFFLSRLRPAAPLVARNSVWIDTVKRGLLLREVRGLGTLVPENLSWIASRNDARVEKILVWPGSAVKPGTVIVSMANPELQQSTLDADAAVTAAEARLVNVKAQLQGQLLERRAALTKAEGETEIAEAELEVNRRLARNGLIATVDLKKSAITARQLRATSEIEKQRSEFAQDSIEPQLAVAQGELSQARAQAGLRHSQLDALEVRAGMTGILQQISVEIGQRIPAGTNVARVADVSRLKAAIKVPETQARDILIGQSATIDTRTSGLVQGRVSRIDPAVQQGTVLVDVSFGGAPLPRGTRPDLSVEGTIELEKMENVIYVGRPAFAQDQGAITLFKVSPDGEEAVRTRVRLGRGSVNAIEIEKGLDPGDQVILSEMSAHDSHERIRLQ